MTLEVYTARLGTTDPDALCITRQHAGPDGLPFAPSWNLLWPYIQKRRAGELTEADWREYTARYLDEMRYSFRVYRPAWDALGTRRRIVLVCTCHDPAAGNDLHCHRRLLARDVLPKVPGLGAVDRGELVTATPAQIGLFGRAAALGSLGRTGRGLCPRGFTG